MILISLSLAWVAGIFLGSHLAVPPWLLLAGLAPFPLGLSTRRYRKAVIVGALGIFLFIGAGVYSHGTLYSTDETALRYYNDRGTYELRGTVATDPDVRDASTRLEVDVTSLNVDDEWREVEGRVLVFVARYPTYNYGDGLRLRGEPVTPPQLDDFDYRRYLEGQGIGTIMRYPEITVQDTGGGFPLLSGIYTVRAELAESLAKALPEPQASLGQGIILGIRGSIPQDVRDDFARSGTAHLLAISGLHLGIMAGILLGIGVAIFGRRGYVYIWVALGGVWLYAIITGLNPPVVRGAIMASLFLTAEALGRQRSGFVALSVAAAVMVGFSPYILGDASFQLSFLAMTGLIFIFPLLRDGGRRLVTARLGEEGALVTSAFLAVDMLSATLGALLAVWPVVAHYFGIVSLAGPLATLLALPVLPAVIVFGVLAAASGLAVPVVGQAIGWLAWLFLSWLVLVTGWLGSASGSTVSVESIHPVIIGGYYVIVALIIWYFTRKQRRRSLAAGTAGRMQSGLNLSLGLSWSRKWVIVPLAVLALLTTVTAFTCPDDDLHVSFLDVGQGEAVLIRQGNSQVLIDGGPGPQAVTNGMADRMPFWDRTLEVLVLTHPHEDHLAGLVEVLRRYEVGQVLVPPIDSDSSLYREWQRLVEEKGITVTVVTAGYCVTVGGDISLTVLHPWPDEGEGVDENTL
ncbi:MAG: ComEC/Rec2 family competence protein, partial [Dehalococcoidales bacterium]|nr:ComEC/Rec2 family competence protein [Dehalococcoidales bacterium]